MFGLYLTPKIEDNSWKKLLPLGSYDVSMENQATLSLPGHHVLHRLCQCLAKTMFFHLHHLHFKTQQFSITCDQAAGDLRTDSKEEKLLYHDHVSAQTSLTQVTKITRYAPDSQSQQNLDVVKASAAHIVPNLPNIESNHKTDFFRISGDMDSLRWQHHASMSHLHGLPHAPCGAGARVEQQPNGFTTPNLKRSSEKHKVTEKAEKWFILWKWIFDLLKLGTKLVLQRCLTVSQTCSVNLLK